MTQCMNTLVIGDAYRCSNCGTYVYGQHYCYYNPQIVWQTPYRAGPAQTTSTFIFPKSAADERRSKPKSRQPY